MELEITLEWTIGVNNIQSKKTASSKTNEEKELVSSFSRRGRTIITRDKKRERNETEGECNSYHVCLICRSKVAIPNTNSVQKIDQHVKVHFTQNKLGICRDDPALLDHGQNIIRQLVAKNKSAKAQYMYGALNITLEKIPLWISLRT